MIANPVQYASGAKTVEVGIANLGGWDNASWLYYRLPNGEYAEYKFEVESSGPVTFSMRAGELLVLLRKSKVPTLTNATQMQHFSAGNSQYVEICQVDA